MPLQKPPPKSRRAVADPKIRSDKHVRSQRRKTLQTISELAPHHAAPQGSTVSLTWTGNAATKYGSPGNSLSGSSRSSRRRSLPVQGSRSQREPAGIPTLTTSIAVPGLHRSVTSPYNQQGSSRNNPRRRSMPSSFEARGRSLSPVAEGELSRNPMPQDDMHPSEPGGVRSRGKQSNGNLRASEQSGGGWNARRERELVKRERALIEANARRARERLGLAIGTSPNLPSSTPVPIAKSDDLIAHQSRFYSQLPSLSQPLSSDPNRRNSRGRHGRQVSGSIIDGRLIQDAETRAWNNTTPNRGLRRSFSATSEHLQGTSFLIEPANKGIAPAIRSASSNSFLSSALAERQLIDPRSSSSLQTSSTSTRSSSSKSSVSGASTATKPSQRSSFAYARQSNHPLRQNPITTNPDIRPPLTQANLETNMPLPTPPPPPDPPLSHAFLGSQLLPQTAYSYSHHPPPQKANSARQRSRSRSRSRSHSRTSSAARQPARKSSDYQNDVIYRENPDKRHLSGKDGSDVLMRRSSREEAERRIAKEKIRERVRRANELEEKKERELVAEGKKRKKEKDKSRGFLCGLFARG